MGRVIGGVIVGYLSIFVTVFALMWAAYAVLGAASVFQPNSWDVSAVWIVVSIAVGLAAAVDGGFVCALISKNPIGPKILIGVLVVLGVLFAIPVILASGGEAAGPRPETVPMFDAMMKAKQPVWVALVNPLVGAVGVIIGAKLTSLIFPSSD